MSRLYAHVLIAPKSRRGCERSSAVYSLNLAVIGGGEVGKPFARTGARAEERAVLSGSSPLRWAARLKPPVTPRGLPRETPTAKTGPLEKVRSIGHVVTLLGDRWPGRGNQSWALQERGNANHRKIAGTRDRGRRAPEVEQGRSV